MLSCLAHHELNHPMTSSSLNLIDLEVSYSKVQSNTYPSYSGVCSEHFKPDMCNTLWGLMSLCPVNSRHRVQDGRVSEHPQMLTCLSSRTHSVRVTRGLGTIWVFLFFTFLFSTVFISQVRVICFCSIMSAITKSTKHSQLQRRQSFLWAKAIL